MKWFMKFNKWVNLEEDSSLAITEYHFSNGVGQDIEVIPEDSEIS